MKERWCDSLVLNIGHHSCSWPVPPQCSQSGCGGETPPSASTDTYTASCGLNMYGVVLAVYGQG